MKERKLIEDEYDLVERNNGAVFEIVLKHFMGDKVVFKFDHPNGAWNSHRKAFIAGVNAGRELAENLQAEIEAGEDL